MSFIHKYVFDSPEITIPLEGRVIAVAWQHGHLVVWVQHDKKFTDNSMVLRAVPTGSEFSVPGPHVGSAISDDLVFHVYRVMV